MEEKGEKPRPFLPSFAMSACFITLLVIIGAAVVILIGWSAAGWDVRGIEVWKYVLTSSLSFLIGFLLGANARG